MQRINISSMYPLNIGTIIHEPGNILIIQWLSHLLQVMEDGPGSGSILMDSQCTHYREDMANKLMRCTKPQRDVIRMIFYSSTALLVLTMLPTIPVINMRCVFGYIFSREIQVDLVQMSELLMFLFELLVFVEPTYCTSECQT